MKMTRKQLDRWNKTRLMGRSRYVWRFWVLGWGLGTALFWSTFMAYKEGWSQLPILLILGLIGFPIVGYFLGGVMWKMAERNFKKVSQNT